jgi:hypothetical protein
MKSMNEIISTLPEKEREKIKIAGRTRVNNNHYPSLYFGYQPLTVFRHRRGDPISLPIVLVDGASGIRLQLRPDGTLDNLSGGIRFMNSNPNRPYYTP